MAASVQDSASTGRDTVTPIQLSLTIGASGNNRAIAVIMGIGDTNPGTHTCTFDPGGADEVAGTLSFQGANGINRTWGWYFLEADLPAAGGTYTVEVSWLLVDNDTGLVACYMEGVEQAAPDIATFSTGTSTGGTFTTSISPNAGAIVFDAAVVEEPTDSGWVPASGQTSIGNQLMGSQQLLSSYSTAESTLTWNAPSAVAYCHGYFSFNDVGGGTSIPVFMNQRRFRA